MKKKLLGILFSAALLLSLTSAAVLAEEDETNELYLDAKNITVSAGITLSYDEGIEDGELQGATYLEDVSDRVIITGYQDLVIDTSAGDVYLTLSEIETNYDYSKITVKGSGNAYLEIDGFCTLENNGSVIELAGSGRVYITDDIRGETQSGLYIETSGTEPSIGSSDKAFPGLTIRDVTVDITSLSGTPCIGLTSTETTHGFDASLEVSGSAKLYMETENDAPPVGFTQINASYNSNWSVTPGSELFDISGLYPSGLVYSSELYEVTGSYLPPRSIEDLNVSVLLDGEVLEDTETIELPYDGNTHVISFSISEDASEYLGTEAYTLVEDTDFEVTGDYSVKNAGEYSALLNLIGENAYEGEMEVNWTITPVEVKLTAENQEKHADQDDSDLTFTVEPEAFTDEFSDLLLVRDEGEAAGKYAVSFPESFEDNYGNFIISSEGAELTITAHEFSDTYVTTKEPTCTETGIESAYCTVEGCNAHTDNDLPANGHSLSHVDEVPAKCLEAGLAEHWVCDVCGVLFADEAGSVITSAERLAIGALQHDIQYYAKKEPTCTEDGYYGYECCAREGCDYSTKEIIAKLSHTPSATAGSEASCTEAGNTPYWTCSVCGKYFSDEACTSEIEENSWVIEALGHDYKITKQKEATCTVDGYISRTCSRCDDSYKETLEAPGHDLEHFEAKEATCTEIGWEAYDACKNCDETTYKEIPALGHSLTKTDAIEPTCTKGGRTAYWTCETCGKYYDSKKANNEIQKNDWILVALGHDLIEHEGLEATCTEDGYKDYVTCSRCNYTTYEDIKATGHVLRAYPSVAATCLEKGSTAYYHCTACNKYFADIDTTEEIKKNSWIVKALGHTYENGFCIRCGEADPNPEPTSSEEPSSSEESSTEESSTEESSTEESSAPESSTEESSTEESSAPESSTEESTTESTTAETTTEEATTESTTAESTTEEPTTESTTEEPTTESTAAESSTEESTAAETTAEEISKETDSAEAITEEAMPGYGDDSNDIPETTKAAVTTAAETTTAEIESETTETVEGNESDSDSNNWIWIALAAVGGSALTGTGIFLGVAAKRRRLRKNRLNRK